MPKKK